MLVAALLSLVALSASAAMQVSDVTVVEGRRVEIVATFDPPPTMPTPVTWRTIGATATSDVDYGEHSGTFTLNTFTTRQTFGTFTIDDSHFEGDEHFFYEFQYGNDAVQVVKVTIIENDIGILAPVHVDVGAAFNVTVLLPVTSNAAQELVVTSSDPAVFAVPSTVTVPPGATQAGFEVQALAVGRATITVVAPPALGGVTYEATIFSTIAISLNFEPPALRVRQGTTAEVTLSIQPAQPDPVIVALDTPPGLIAPPTIIVPPSGSVTFNITGTTLGTHTLIATVSALYGSRSTSMTIAVVDPSSQPSISRVTPSTGASAGGTEVVINGTALTGCQVRFGGRAARVIGASATSMTVATPPHPAGSVALTLTCGSETFALTHAYTYADAAPSVASVAPQFGNTSGGTRVRVIGAHLLSTCGVTFGGAPARNVTRESETSLLATAPPHAEGRVDVSVVCTTGTASLANAFSYTSVIEPQAAISTLDRTQAAPGDTLTLRGVRFRVDDTVLVGDREAAVLRVTPESLVVRVPDLAPGVVGVTVRDTFGRTTATAPILTIVAPRTPEITGISSLIVGAGGELHVEGRNFRPGVAFSISGLQLPAVVLDPTRAVLRIPSNAPGGAHVLYAGETAGPRIVIDAQLPAIHSVISSCATTGGGTLVTIFGSNFAAGATVTIGDLPATVLSREAGRLRVIVPPGEAGYATIAATANGTTATLSNALWYRSPLHADAVCPGIRRRIVRH